MENIKYNSFIYTLRVAIVLILYSFYRPYLQLFRFADFPVDVDQYRCRRQTSNSMLGRTVHSAVQDPPKQYWHSSCAPKNGSLSSSAQKVTKFKQSASSDFHGHQTCLWLLTVALFIWLYSITRKISRIFLKITYEHCWLFWFKICSDARIADFLFI